MFRGAFSSLLPYLLSDNSLTNFTLEELTLGL